MTLKPHRHIKKPKRKREYLPLAYAIRKSKAANVFVIQSALSAAMGAIRLATITSMPTDFRDGDAKMDKALQIVESIKNTSESISKGAEKLKKVY